MNLQEREREVGRCKFLLLTQKAERLLLTTVGVVIGMERVHLLRTMAKPNHTIDLAVQIPKVLIFILFSFCCFHPFIYR